MGAPPELAKANPRCTQGANSGHTEPEILEVDGSPEEQNSRKESGDSREAVDGVHGQLTLHTYSFCRVDRDYVKMADWSRKEVLTSSSP